jgi:hypothetical protein
MPAATSAMTPQRLLHDYLLALKVMRRDGRGNAGCHRMSRKSRKSRKSKPNSLPVEAYRDCGYGRLGSADQQVGH